MRNSEQSKASENIGKYLENTKYFGADNTIETIKSYMKTLTESKLILATINYNSSASLDKNTNPMIMSSVICIQFGRTGVIGVINSFSNSTDWTKITPT